MSPAPVHDEKNLAFKPITYGLIGVLLVWPLHQLNSQSIRYDTVYVDSGAVIHIGKEKYRLKNDTVFYIARDTKYKISHPGKRSESFFKNLEQQAQTSRWIKSLHNVVVVPPGKDTEPDTTGTTRAGAEYVRFSGKHIGAIRFNILDPFGPSFQDTTLEAKTSVGRLGNRLHVNTRVKVLERYLLFKSGDILDPYVIADNERIIRELGFIEDVRIILVPDPLLKDQVDVLIIAKDRWPVGLDGEMGPPTRGKVKLFSKNILGSGQETSHSLYWNTEKPNIWGYEGSYKFNNLFGSFTDATLRYADIFEQHLYELRLRKKFMTPETRLAGGLILKHETNDALILYPDDSQVVMQITDNAYDLWLGYAIPLNRGNFLSRKRFNLILSGRWFSQFFEERPGVSENTFPEYHNKTFLLASLSISRQAFYKGSLVYSYGQTEDIPTGTLLTMNLGPEFNEFNRRIYAGVSLSTGNFLKNFGYLYGRFDLGAYIREPGNYNQGSMHINANYFSNLFLFGNFKFRQFVDLGYVQGIDRLDTEFLYLNNNEGIRGFKNYEIKGKKRLSLKLETLSFSPYYLYGFRFAFFGFYDTGVVGEENEPLTDFRFYHGLGFGIRIKNERLVFPTVQVRLGFYPAMPPGSEYSLLSATSRTRLGLQDFYVQKPEMVTFE